LYTYILSLHDALPILIEVRSTVGRDPVMLLVHDDESRAVTFVSAAGSRLRLDASRLARLELNDHLADVQAVLGFRGRLRKHRPAHVHRLFGLVQCRGTDLHNGQRHGLPYGESEGIKVTEPARPQKLNNRKRCEERSLAVGPSLSLV